MVKIKKEVQPWVLRGKLPQFMNHVEVIKAAAERYATYREQQAKHVGFIEGAKAQRERHIDALTGIIGLRISHDDVSYHAKELGLAFNPYEPREKGGEDDHR